MPQKAKGLFIKLKYQKFQALISKWDVLIQKDQMNECLIHLCDYTWLNMLHMLKYMLIKHKKIFKRFSCFWKVFLFWKFSKISKIVQPCSSDLPHRSSQSQAYTKGFCDSLAGQGPSCEKDLENFSKIWVFRCLTTQFGDLCASGSSNR